MQAHIWSIEARVEASGSAPLHGIDPFSAVDLPSIKEKERTYSDASSGSECIGSRNPIRTAIYL